jgi:2-keto-3-deoxy-L-fuconate dehydrogenase
MASDQALVGKEGSIVYGATKGAVAQMAKSLAVALSPYGIRVNAVCPATVKTPLTEGVFQWLADKNFGGDVAAAWPPRPSYYLLDGLPSPRRSPRWFIF